MSLDKAIEHGKEKRKPYRGSKAIDGTCRNHGGCPWCEENRKHKFRDKHPVTTSEMREAMRDLKLALSASGIGDNGNFCCYEINGTAKVIPVAVAALVQIRREDGDGDG